MKYLQLFILLLLVTIIACDPAATGPEMNCQMDPSYNLDFFAVESGKVFDIRENPPLELKDGFLESRLSSQFLHNTLNKPNLPPYDRYFVQSIRVLDNDTRGELSFLEGDTISTLFHRNDCQLDFIDGADTLHAELMKSGNEISLNRFAFFEHSQNSSGFDTFIFIEFRNHLFKSYHQIIAEFAQDHAGEYDTISLELVKNRTRK